MYLTYMHIHTYIDISITVCAYFNHQKVGEGYEPRFRYMDDVSQSQGTWFEEWLGTKVLCLGGSQPAPRNLVCFEPFRW